MKKDRLNVYFDPALSAELDALAARRKVSKSQIVEAALASYLSPDAADHLRRAGQLARAVVHPAVRRAEEERSLSTHLEEV